MGWRAATWACSTVAFLSGAAVQADMAQATKVSLSGGLQNMMLSEARAWSTLLGQPQGQYWRLRFSYFAAVDCLPESGHGVGFWFEDGIRDVKHQGFPTHDFVWSPPLSPGRPGPLTQMISFSMAVRGPATLTLRVHADGGGKRIASHVRR